MDEHSSDPEPQTDGPAPGPQALWKWFRLVGLPLIAIVVITGAILWLRAPSGSGEAVAIDTGELEGGEDPGVNPQPGAPAPDFELKAPDGTVYRLSDLRGRPVMLNFWATWCGPCRQEMPAIEDEYRARGGDGLVVLAINVKESRGLVEPFVQRLGLTFPVLLDHSGSVSARYRVRSLPTTFFVAPDGTIDGMRQGAYTRRMLADRLDQFLERE